ncbi:hypothetical protein ES702_06571 [subsurface metagenome]
MARDDYVLEAFIRALRKKVSGFKREPDPTQHYFAKLIWESGLKHREHKTFGDDYMTIGYQELYGKFGRNKFEETNDRLGIFEVTPTWSKKKKYTKGYRLTDKIKGIKSTFLNGNIRRIDKLVGGDGKHIRTPPKAVASKDMKGITASRWRNTKFKSNVPVDIPTLKLLRKGFKAIRKDMDAGHWNLNLFYTDETPEKVDRCLEVIAQVLRMAHTDAAGFGYVIHRYVESDAGRLYAKNINLQTTPRVVKQAALHGLWEYDFSNCHYAIFHQLAEQAGVKCPNIQHYLAHKSEVRRQIAREVQIINDDAKVCLIAIMYGAMESLWHESAIPETIGSGNAKRLYQHHLFKGLMSEINIGREAILKWWPGKGRTAYKNAMDKYIGKKESQKKILAHLIQGIEAKMLNIVMHLYPDKLLLLQHDGFATSIRLDRGQISSQIKKETGFDMQLSEDHIQVCPELNFPKREIV